MKRIMAFLLAGMVHMVQSASGAVGMGYLYCDSNLNGVADLTDKPVPSALGVFINSSGTFSNANWTTAQGFFIVSLPDEPDTYTLTIHPLTLPQGTTQILPTSHTIQITTDNKSVLRTFLISSPNCDSITPGIHYVNASSSNPSAPYTSWATAARNIQDALDIANPGSIVYVTNGVYSSGGRVVHGSLNNRVALSKAITLTSINGPSVTTIIGATPGGAGRCAYLADGTILSGFTLKNGQTLSMAQYPMDEDGGGIYADTANSFITNCVIIDNHAYGWGGGAFRGDLNNCVISQNTADLYGGGAYESWIENCRIRSNQAELGGGVYSASVFDSLIESNRVATYASHGGGASFSVLTRSTIIANRADSVSGGGGGGASHSDLIECTVESNVAAENGGGTLGGTLNRTRVLKNTASKGGGTYETEAYTSLLLKNSASQGGGAHGGKLVFSTVVGNHAAGSGGGTHSAEVSNSIVWDNTSAQGANYADGLFNHSCTMPLPMAGGGNISVSPLFTTLSDFRLKPASQCINAASGAGSLPETDFSGQPRVISGIPDMGAYENQDAISIPFVSWLQSFGLAIDGSATYTDQDGDGHTTWAEWIAGTEPTNKTSSLSLKQPVKSADGISLTWDSVAGRTYSIDRSERLDGGFQRIRSNIAGQAGTTSILDTAAAGPGAWFYRVGVE